MVTEGNNNNNRKTTTIASTPWKYANNKQLNPITKSTN